MKKETKIETQTLKENKQIELKFDNSFIGLNLNGVNYPIPEDLFIIVKQLNQKINETNLFNEFLLLEKNINVTEFQSEFTQYLEKNFGGKK